MSHSFKAHQRVSPVLMENVSSYVPSHEWYEFTNGMSYAIVCALKRKRSLLIQDKLKISEAMVDYLREQHSLSGRYKSSELLQELSLVTEISLNEFDIKRVVNFEARIFVKRPISVIVCGKRKIIKPPSHISFKVSSDIFGQ